MEVKTKEKSKKQSLFSGIGISMKESISRESGGMGNFRMWINLATITLGFLFGGCHLLFGAYPLGLALISALPVSVWLATLGVVAGSLTLGRSGVIYALICVLGVFLRVIISGNDKIKEKDGTRGEILFTESISLRISSAVIAGFVAGVYEILLEGFSFETVLFGISMVIMPAVFTFIFAGAFCHGIGVKALIFGGRSCFEMGEEKKDNLKNVYFRVSLLCFLALTAIALDKYRFFGIDLSFVFASAVTLFTAKRFGALYGTVVGFISSALVSGIYSPGFALVGAGSGAIFSLGSVYAMLFGGILLSLWGGYVSGVTGFLSLLPEFIMASSIMLPMMRYFERENSCDVKESVSRRATDMVGTMALSYRNRQITYSESVEQSLSLIAPLLGEFCHGDTLCESYNVFLRLLSEAKERTVEKRELDEGLTDKLEAVFYDFGFSGGLIRVFGDRRKYLICSGKDKDGTLITSPALIERYEAVSGLRFSNPEYYRRDDMVLMECEAVAKYKLFGAVAGDFSLDDKISGDSVKLFESKELFSYGVICDGMGSGIEARDASRFSVDFLNASLGCDVAVSTALHMLNGALNRGREECSVAIDIFSMDLITGEARFIKSGAASSFIKRKNSLFRIKSETMPIGIIKRIDAEQIAANVCEDDYVIMLSDGVCDPCGDSPWLLELLNGAPIEDLKAYAEYILGEAKRKSESSDDMSVLVLKVGIRE